MEHRQTDIKVYVVLDCEITDPAWTPQIVQENMPDYVETLCGVNEFNKGDAYILTNPTVYVRIEDFDADRAEKLDHFNPCGECAGGALAGVLVNQDGGRARVERCDSCARYVGDLEAAKAYADAMTKANHVQFIVYYLPSNTSDDYGIEWDGKDLPAGVHIREQTDPWVVRTLRQPIQEEVPST